MINAKMIARIMGSLFFIEAGFPVIMEADLNGDCVRQTFIDKEIPVNA